MPEKHVELPAVPDTSKIRAIGKFHSQGALGDDTADSVLNEVHLLPNGALSDDVIVRLENFKSQLGQHGRHKVWLRVGKKRHGRHQLTTVEVHDFLRKKKKEVSQLCSRADSSGQ